MTNYLQDSQIQVIDDWTEFQQIVSGPQYRGWAFRGQENSEWPIFSTLSRYFLDYKIHRKAWGHQEERIFRIFRRKAHLFLEHIPEKEDTFQWLALMQHHGAPTRLLDFTWSPYVAAFFALEKAQTDCAVWAISYPKFWDILHTFPKERSPRYSPEPRTPEDFEKYFIWNDVPFITTGEPYNMNQRLIAQSGTFVTPGVLDLPIEAIVDITCLEKETALFKFVLKTETLRDEAMHNLYTMNISNATLFPGLDGMARSLAYELETHWGFDPKSGENHPGYTYFED